MILEDLRGARVLIVGGRQSAYEWAALIGEQGAERIDIVHRHDVPFFDRVSWKFVDDYVDSMLAVPGWWRTLPHSEQERIARQFWEVGRLTLEWWLIPRLASGQFHRWPGTSVINVRRETAEPSSLTCRTVNACPSTASLRDRRQGQPTQRALPRRSG